MRDDDTPQQRPLASFRAHTARRPNASGLRLSVLRRDNFRCQYCGDDANEVDHVIPYSFGGLDRADNLVACCHWCNQQLSDRFFDEGVDGKRLFIAERLHLKAKHFRRRTSICGDCAAVYSPQTPGATAVLCAECADRDREELNGSLVPQSAGERAKTVKSINAQLEQSQGRRVREESAPYG